MEIVRNNSGFLKLATRLSAPNSPLLFDKLQVLILTPDLLNQDLPKVVPCASILLLLTPLEVKTVQLDRFLFQNTFIFGKQDNSCKNIIKRIKCSAVKYG